MARRGVKTPSIFAITLLLILCLGTVAGGWFIYYSLSQKAVGLYGPPTPGLSFSQRIIYSYRLVSGQAKLTQPEGLTDKPVLFTIQLGESVSSIATRLQSHGLIADGEIFGIYLIYSGLDTRLQAGEYQLTKRMSAIEIARQLIDPTPGMVVFGILPGWRMEEIAGVLPTSGLAITAEDFLSEAHNLEIAPGLKDQIPESASLEGFLLPGEYQFSRNISAGEMLVEIIDRFNKSVNSEMRAGFESHGLSLYQAVIMASIVQKEAVIEEEQPIIASVFYNRLSEGMKMESDPTAQYALGWNAEQHTWWTNPLSSDDLMVDSPYNTYLYVGLPPGPISNPGISALQAVASPARTSFYYFRARCDGSGMHHFSESFDEHIQNACQ